MHDEWFTAVKHCDDAMDHNTKFVDFTTLESIVTSLDSICTIEFTRKCWVDVDYRDGM